MDMNPFGIGPAGATFLTCFVCGTILGCVSAVCYTTWLCVKEICGAVKEMWQDIRDVFKGMNGPS